MGWQEKIEKYTQEQKEATRLKQLKEKEAARVMEEEKLRIIKERNLPLIEQLNKLPVKEFLTEIRDDEWKLGEIVSVPEEPKIRLIAKWPRLIADHQHPIYETADMGEEVVGWESADGVVESQGEVIEIGVRWENIVNPEEQVFYSEEDLPPEFYYYWEERNWWYPNDEGRKLFIENITGKSIYNFISYPKASEGDKQPFSLQRNRDRREEESSLPKKEKMVLYGHALRWYTNMFYRQNLNLSCGEHPQYCDYYSGFEGPSINNPNVVSKIEESLIKMCLIRKEEKFPPPFDRYKKEYKLEAMEVIKAGKFQRGFKNISPKEIKEMFT